MNQDKKQLLLKDLSARLPYRVKVCLYEKETCILMGIDGCEVYLDVDSDSFRIESIRPYLRSMSNMTEEEKDTYDRLIICNAPWEVNDWLNVNHFDYRGLIPKGLAIEVTKENNPYEKINL